MNHWDSGDEPFDDREQASYGPQHEPGHRQEGPAYYGPPGQDARADDWWYGADEPDSGPSGWPDAQPDPGPPDGDWHGYGEYMPGHASGQDEYPPPNWSADLSARHGTNRTRRTTSRLLVIAAAVIVCIFAVAAVAFKIANTAQVTPDSPGTAVGPRAAGPGSHAQPAPAISRAEAQQVLARYTSVNNQANELAASTLPASISKSDALLASIEGGSSYPMDIGSYRFQRANPKKSPYVPFELAEATYYIPRLPSSVYPRWFAVRGTYIALPATAAKALGSAYLVFAQDSAGARWKDVVEPDALSGHVLPRIATDADGYATAVTTTGDSAGLSVAPGQIGRVTATYLDRVAADPVNTAVLAEAGNLTDLKDEVFWRSGEGGIPLSAGDSHSVPAGPVFGFKTISGGALLFYTVDAHLTLTPPAGSTISGLNIPGYYSPSSSAGLTSAEVGYIEQFATYLPATGQRGRRIVADISSIASRG